MKKGAPTSSAVPTPGLTPTSKLVIDDDPLHGTPRPHSAVCFVRTGHVTTRRPHPPTETCCVTSTTVRPPDWPWAPYMSVSNRSGSAVVNTFDLPDQKLRRLGGVKITPHLHSTGSGGPFPKAVSAPNEGRPQSISDKAVVADHRRCSTQGPAARSWRRRESEAS